jgi:hypothetical protein
MGDGYNIVLFKADNADPTELKYVRVTGIKHSFEELNEHDLIYDEGPFDYLFRN